MADVIIPIIFYYVVLLISIPLYYKIRKIRQPFTKWGEYKDDVGFGERMWHVFYFITIPLIIELFIL